MTNLKLYIVIALLLLICGILMFITGTEYVDYTMAVTLVIMSGVFLYLYKVKKEAEKNDE